MGPRAGQRKSKFTLGFDRRCHAPDGKVLPCHPFDDAIYNGANVCTLVAAAERNLGRHGPGTPTSRWQRDTARTCRRRDRLNALVAVQESAYGTKRTCRGKFAMSAF